MLFAIVLSLLGAGQAPAIAPQAPPVSAPAGADVSATLASLGSFDLATRTRAAQAVRRWDRAVALPALVAAVEKHPDEYVRFRALVLLSGVDAEATSRAARAVLADRNDRLRMVAYQWFERHPDPELLPALLEALPREGSEFVRPALMRALAAHGRDERAQATLVPLVTRGADFFRAAVIEALGEHEGRFALTTIATVAKLEGPLQDEAVMALGRLGDATTRAEVAALQGRGERDLQPTVSAALCLLGLDCDARLAYLRQTLQFGSANDGYQSLLRAAAHAAGVLAAAGRVEAWGVLFDAADGAAERAREGISVGLTLAALDDPNGLVTALERRKDLIQIAELLLEGFDLLSEDLNEERFATEIRRAYWAAPADSPRRAVIEALMRKLEF